MLSSLTRSHALILPLVILFAIFVEELCAYQLRLHVADVRVRTAAIMVLYGPLIALFTEVVGPRLSKALVFLRSRSRRSRGRFGTAAFFVAAYAVAYYGFLTLETKGAGAFIPS